MLAIICGRRFARRLAQLRDCARSLAEPAAELAGELDARLSRRPIGSAAIHGDFYTKQVLIDSDCAAILDLDDAAIGEPEQDLGNFLGHLDWYLQSGRVSPRSGN